MAGIKIHQYPLERTSIGDEDYYDIDYWTGSSYQSAKIKGSTLKNVLGADYIDITAFISGYELTDKDAGKLITNSNANVRTLVIPSGLALPNNMITVKGRIAIQPEIGVNITLPDGSTITDPTQFTCVADEVYILHKSAFSGDNYILVSVKKSENLATNDLTQEDFTRNYIFPNGNYSLRFIQGAFAHMVLDTVGGSPTLLVGKNSNGTALQVNKVSGSGNAFEVTGGNTVLERQLELNSVTNGFLMNRVTTAQMNGISSPATHLLVFNTDLNGLYRYTGSAWVALSAGYGIIEVRDSSGYPTFYADLQTAINATADKDTVYIHSDIQITSQVSLPQRSSLTFQMNGRRLWSDTSGGDFNIFRVTANSGNPQRHLRFEGGGLIEQTGTVVDVINAAIFHRLNGGTTPMELFLGTTIFRAENARVMYSNGFTSLDGGYLIATNNTIEINANVFNSYWDCYETCYLPNTSKIKNTILKTRYGGYFAPSGGGELENCHIEGDVTKSGNFGLLYVNGAYNVRNCFLRQTHATGRDALYVRGSGSGGDISNNVCINLGTSAAGNFVFGAGSHNYFYSNGGNGLVVGGSCTRFNDNVCITNGATTQRALDCQGTIIYNNTAINLNASNTVEAMYVGRTSGTCQIYNNRAQVTNAAAYNIKFYVGGTNYVANNVMGLTGLGINPSPALVNSQTNTPDAYGNIKIG